MNNYYKLVNDDGFIIGFGTNGGDDTLPITEEEYKDLIKIFSEMPNPEEGYEYFIRDNPRDYVTVAVESNV